MRWIGMLLLMTAVLTRAEDTSLDQAKVTISYGELRRLIESAQKKQAPAPAEPPVAAAILAADYDVMLEKTSVRGTASFQMQSYREEAILMPLIGAAAKIERIEPRDTLLILQEGKYAVVLDGKKAFKVTLHFSLPLMSSNSAWQGEIAIPVSALSSLRVQNIRPGEEVFVENAALQGQETTEQRWQLGAISNLRIARQEKPKTAPAVDLPKTRIETPSIVRTAAAETRIVRDGSYISTTTWIVKHDAAMNWNLTLPEGSQLLSCQIARQPAAPLVQDARTLVLCLPTPVEHGETRVELTYTGRKTAFDPLRGECFMELPMTTLLVESLVWQLMLPRPYETIAIQGNVDFAPTNNPGEIRLTRELGRGDTPTVHVFYQKPETTSKK